MENINETIVSEKPKTRKKSVPKVVEEVVPEQKVKTKVCKVILYNEPTKELYVVFDGYGISIKNVEFYDGSNSVSVKYTGEIGNADFDCKL